LKDGVGRGDTINLSFTMLNQQIKIIVMFDLQVGFGDAFVSTKGCDV
jgi:hypothetical protein